MHVFCDASKDAIGAVAYLQLFGPVSSKPTLSFLLGKGKLAPNGGNTIPRMDRTAVLGIEVADIIKEQLGIPSVCFRYYTDSQIVLGYLTNTTRRFYVYVSNRVKRVHSSSSPTQWTHVPTEQNPAGLATRSVCATQLSSSMWLTGPPFRTLTKTFAEPLSCFPLVEPNNDCEIGPEVTCSKVQVNDVKLVNPKIGSERFLRFSIWESLVRGDIGDIDSSDANERTELFVIQTTQGEAYGDAIRCIKDGRPLPKGHSLMPLSPFIDQHGILRVGGRLDKNGHRDDHLHPVIMSKNHFVTRLRVRKFHHQVLHQGRLLTEGALRSGGFWVVGAKNLTRSEIKSCVTCRKLRGSFGWQKMADLPEDRIPFSYVGVDTFGPWTITQRRTRGRGTVNQKRWALMFTCLVSRAVHLEAIEELSTASLINALRRFIAIRDPVIQFRSDRGTNFIGAVHELNIPSNLVENPASKRYLEENKINWVFNPPHASHFGGAWERMIGASRKLLDSLLLSRKGPLTHEVLTTFLMEVSAILNVRPLVAVSADPDTP